MGRSVVRFRRILPLSSLAALAIFVAATGVDAQSSLLHEPIPPDPQDDLKSAATTEDGDLPAAIQTPSGPVAAPDTKSPPGNRHVYSSDTVDDGPESTYEPDRDTRKPNIERYDDPFSPATAPFKRLRAYDAVGPGYTLTVRTRTLMPLIIGGSMRSGDETFYGDLSLDLVPGEAVRIPTVGPDTRILRAHVTPDAEVEFLHDGADNWFIRGKVRQRVRVVEQLAIQRASFGSAFEDVDWFELTPHLDAPPEIHRAAFEEVARTVGISRAMRPAQALAKMVDYFRSFTPSDDPPRGRNDIYLDLALTKKGVCRHRAFAFLVTALYLGLPARMVLNEAHAWVEVYDARLWHRIDLGGAANNLQQDNRDQRPPYVPPPDPYQWPPNQDTGQDLANRSRTGPNTAPTSSASAGPSASPTASGSPSEPGRRSDVTLGEIEGRVVRGAPMRVLGRVKSEMGPCSHVRVDVLLLGQDGQPPVAVGSLSTDDQGNYDGPVVVPSDFRLGTYDLVVQTPGDAACPAGESAR